MQERVGLDDTPLVVSPLWPWVAEVDVHHPRDAVREAVAEEIARIGQQDANMLKLISPKTISCGTPEISGPLDAEEIAFRLNCRLLAEECPLA